jgi:N4-gp56 family major capsid protein
MPVTFDGPDIPGAIITGTSTSSGVANGALAAQVVKTTFDKIIGFKLRTEPMLRRFAEVRPVDVAHPGSSVDMFIQGADLALATTPLNEYEDPDNVFLPAPAKVTLTPFEYGNATVTSLRLREFSFSQIDPYQGELIARNLRDTVDKLVENVAYATTGGVSDDGFAKFHVPSAGGIATTAAPASGNPGKLNSAALRRLVANFRGNNVMEFEDGNFVAMIHPDQAVDLREETDVAGWRIPHTYAENANSFIWNGEVGSYEGVKFIESPRTPNTGTGATRVYKTLVLGKQGLAEGVVREFGTIVTPSLDKFGRLFGLGWFGWAGWSIYREESGAVLSTSASQIA